MITDIDDIENPEDVRYIHDVCLKATGISFPFAVLEEAWEKVSAEQCAGWLCVVAPGFDNTPPDASAATSSDVWKMIKPYLPD